MRPRVHKTLSRCVSGVSGDWRTDLSLCAGLSSFLPSFLPSVRSVHALHAAVSGRAHRAYIGLRGRLPRHDLPQDGVRRIHGRWQGRVQREIYYHSLFSQRIEKIQASASPSDF